jgi:formylmethanofuran dehydrogenase subunit C
VGLTLRRGLIAIGGACGDFVGANMAAGTVLVFGACGIRPAAGMRRGTVGFLGDSPNLLVTFRKSYVGTPAFLRLTLRHLQSLGFAVPGDLFDASYGVYSGDLVTVGRGEILIRESGVA